MEKYFNDKFTSAQTRWLTINTQFGCLPSASKPLEHLCFSLKWRTAHDARYTFSCEENPLQWHTIGCRNKAARWTDSMWPQHRCGQPPACAVCSRHAQMIHLTRKNKAKQTHKPKYVDWSNTTLLYYLSASVSFVQICLHRKRNEKMAAQCPKLKSFSFFFLFLSSLHTVLFAYRVAAVKIEIKIKRTAEVSRNGRILTRINE